MNVETKRSSSKRTLAPEGLGSMGETSNVCFGLDGSVIVTLQIYHASPRSSSSSPSARSGPPPLQRIQTPPAGPILAALSSTAVSRT